MIRARTGDQLFPGFREDNVDTPSPPFIRDSRHACVNAHRSTSFQFTDKGSCAENKIDRRKVRQVGRQARQAGSERASERANECTYVCMYAFRLLRRPAEKNRDAARTQKLATEKPQQRNEPAKLVVPRASAFFRVRAYLSLVRGIPDDDIGRNLRGLERFFAVSSPVSRARRFYLFRRIL